MITFDFIFSTTFVPYIFRKFIFWCNNDHDTPLCDTPQLDDTPLCDTPNELYGMIGAADYVLVQIILRQNLVRFLCCFILKEDQ